MYSVGLNLQVQCHCMTGFDMYCICSRLKILRLPAGASPRPALREAHVPQVRHRVASAPNATSVAHTPAVAGSASLSPPLILLHIWAIAGVSAWRTTAASAAHRPRVELQTNERLGHGVRASNVARSMKAHVNCVKFHNPEPRGHSITSPYLGTTVWRLTHRLKRPQLALHRYPILSGTHFLPLPRGCCH